MHTACFCFLLLTHWPLRDLDAILKMGIFNLVLLIGIFRSSHDNALRLMPQDLTYGKSTLVQVMAWCRQATSHYLSQCWLSSLSPYGIARPQWVKLSVLCPSVADGLIQAFCAQGLMDCKLGVYFSVALKAGCGIGSEEKQPQSYPNGLHLWFLLVLLSKFISKWLCNQKAFS